MKHGDTTNRKGHRVMAGFEPMTVALIKQGGFLVNLEKAFQEAQDRLIEHIEEYGLSAETSIVAKIKIKHDAPMRRKSQETDELPVFGIASEVQVNVPKKPVQFSNSFQSEDQTGRKCLFAPSGGSIKGNPRQAIMQDEEQQPIGS